MNAREWKELLNSLTIQGKLNPSSSEGLDSYEKKSGLRLPSSYRAFCKTLGAGRLGDWYDFAVPNYNGKGKKTFLDLDAVTRFYHDGLPWEESAPDPDQFKRSIIFAHDSTGSVYYWDADMITDKRASEYAVFAMFRDMTGERLCDSFGEFFHICLHMRRKKLYDEPPRKEWQAK
jgi:hypothetical protein